MMTKTRLTVTVDSHLLDAGNEAVATKRVASLSAWVNLALAERAAKEHRLQALGEAVAAYERQFGTISAAEITRQARADRAAALVVRDRPRARRRRANGRGAV